MGVFGRVGISIQKKKLAMTFEFELDLNEAKVIFSEELRIFCVIKTKYMYLRMCNRQSISSLFSRDGLKIWSFMILLLGGRLAMCCVVDLFVENIVLMEELQLILVNDRQFVHSFFTWMAVMLGWATMPVGGMDNLSSRFLKTYANSGVIVYFSSLLTWTLKEKCGFRV